jgi:hypothetical protein
MARGSMREHTAIQPMLDILASLSPPAEAAFLLDDMRLLPYKGEALRRRS